MSEIPDTPAPSALVGGQRRRRLAWAASLVGPLVVAAGLSVVRSSFVPAAAALVMVVVVVAVAVLGSRGAGVLASLTAALWFDLFLTRPYGKLLIDSRPDVETTISLVVVGVVVTEIAARSRRHLAASTEAARRASVIHDVAESGAGSAPEWVVVADATRALVDLLELRECRFDAEVPSPPLARIGLDGEVIHVGQRWPTEEIGIPGPEAEIVAQWRGRVVGRFVLTPNPGRPVSVERRVAAVSLVDLVAATLAVRDRAL